MIYFLDTEFLEGTQKTFFGKTKPTIDLISIGIVSADGREYYAISKEFNLKEAWNRHDLVINKQYPMGPEYNKVYWIRENVLKPIFYDLFVKEYSLNQEVCLDHKSTIEAKMTYSWIKKLLNKYGKTNKQIAEEVIVFVSKPIYIHTTEGGKHIASIDPINSHPIFYGYYCDYDWVAFCWLFGKMLDLPMGFPMYCRDLKQELDYKLENFNVRNTKIDSIYSVEIEALPINKRFGWIKNLHIYPKQTNEHNALADAKWNRELYQFLTTI